MQVNICLGFASVEFVERVAILCPLSFTKQLHNDLRFFRYALYFWSDEAEWCDRKRKEKGSSIEH